MVLTEAFKKILNISGDLSQPSNVTFETSAFLESIKGTTFVTTDVLRPSIIQDSTSIILENLKKSFFDVTRFNLLALGADSEDISFALNENLTRIEIDRKIDVESVANKQIQINQLNERLSKQVSELGQALSNLGSGGFDPIKFLFDNPIFAGIGIGGLLVGGVVLFLVIK